MTAPVADDQVSGIVTVAGTVSNGAPDAGNPTVSAVVDDDHQGTDTPTVAQGATGNFSIDLDLSDLTGLDHRGLATDASGITTTTPVGVDVTIVAPAGVSVSTPVNGDPAITSESVEFEGTATIYAADAQVMSVHITDVSNSIDETFDVDPAVGPDSSGGWTRYPAVGIGIAMTGAGRTCICKRVAEWQRVEAIGVKQIARVVRLGELGAFDRCRRKHKAWPGRHPEGFSQNMISPSVPTREFVLWPGFLYRHRSTGRR